MSKIFKMFLRFFFLLFIYFLDHDTNLEEMENSNSEVERG